MASPIGILQDIWLYVTGSGSSSESSSSEPGGSTGAGVNTDPQDSQASAGGNIQVRLFLRQAKSSDAGKIKIQVRAYFFYAPYSSENTATLRAWWGSSPSGNAQMVEIWGWNRVLSHNDDDRKVFSEWFTIGEVANTTSTINVYVACQPSTSYPEVGYQLQLHNARRSFWLNISGDSNVKNLSYKIEDGSGVYGANRLNQTGQYAIVYEGDKITWSATPKSGYKIDPKDATVVSGSTTISGSSTVKVSAYTYIKIICKAMATLRMKIAGAWNMYSIYVRRSGAWVQHQAHIRSSNKWDQYS